MESQAEKARTASVDTKQETRPIVVLIDERQLLRDCISRALQRHAVDIEFRGFSSIDEARLQHISLIVFLIEWFGSNELSLIEQLLKTFTTQNGRARLVVFLGRGEPGPLKRATELGIALLKLESVNSETAVAAIRLALAGCLLTATDILLSAEDVAQSARFITRGPSSKSVENAEISCSRWITPREMELLKHLNRGLQNKVIAHELGISESTVKVHLRNIMRKLNVTNRTQVAVLMREHITTPPSEDNEIQLS